MKIIAQYGCYENGSYKVLEILELEDVQENCSLMVEEVNNKMKTNTVYRLTAYTGDTRNPTPIILKTGSSDLDQLNFRKIVDDYNDKISKYRNSHPQSWSYSDRIEWNKNFSMWAKENFNIDCVNNYYLEFCLDSTTRISPG